MSPVRPKIENRHGERIACTYTPAASGSGRLLVIGHGVTSDKTRPWSIALSAAAKACGIASLRIAFSGNGESEGRFEDSTITKEVDDLGAVLDALDPGLAVAYAGHSMGGAVGVLQAARDRRIRALVSLAGIVHTHAFAERLFGRLVPGRDVMLGKAHCPLTQRFLDDLCAIDSVIEAGASLSIPWLLVHGSMDDIVPLQDSLDARAAAADRPELVVLDGVDHSFTGSGTAAMTGAVVRFLSRVFDLGPSPPA